MWNDRTQIRQSWNSFRRYSLFPLNVLYLCEVSLSFIIISVFNSYLFISREGSRFDSTLVTSNLRKLEAAIASKDASPQYWVKGLDTLVQGGGGGLHFFSTYRTVCHRHQGVNSFNTYFFTSALVMSDPLPAVTGCSWLVVECAPLEHWGIKHEAAPDLISGTRRDFVLWQRWFCSGFSFHAASVLLGFAKGGCVSGLNIGPRESNRFFFCTSELWRDRPGGVVEGQQNSGNTWIFT